MVVSYAFDCLIYFIMIFSYTVFLSKQRQLKIYSASYSKFNKIRLLIWVYDITNIVNVMELSGPLKDSVKKLFIISICIVN